MARCSRISTARSAVAPIPTSSSTTGSRPRPMTKTAKSKPTWGAAVCKGDLGRVRINAGGAGGGRGGPGAAAGVRVVAQLPLLAQPLPVLVLPAPGAAGQGRGGPGAAACSWCCGRSWRSRCARGGGGGARGGAAANPIVLSRNGRKFTVTGATNVRAGTEIKAETQAPSVSINLSELDSGSWVIFELPGFTTAATGTAQNSLDALRSATSTSYYKGENALWVKVVSTGGPVRPWRSWRWRRGHCPSQQVS